MASPTLGHRFDSELNRLETEAARRKEGAPSVLVGSPLSADEVRTELPVVQATFLTRQMSQSANVAERETKTEIERSMAEKGKEEAGEECRKEKAKEERRRGRSLMMMGPTGSCLHLDAHLRREAAARSTRTMTRTSSAASSRCR